MFADFDLDGAGQLFLRRISFDGYGCCRDVAFTKMNLDDSSLLMQAVERDAVDQPQVDAALRTYFRENSGIIWSDALASYDLL